MKESNLAYSLFIKCEIDGVEQLLGLDYVDDNSNYNVNSDITTHPLVNGDIIADHMYVRASTANYSGTFSLLGNKKGITYITEDSQERVEDYSTDIHSRLSMIQKIFERINREGIICTIVRRSNDGDTSRFTVRKNMALTSIVWNEHQYSIDFQFGFTEVLTAVVEEEIYEESMDDEDLPILTSPVSADLNETFINKNDLKEFIKETLNSIELGSEFWFGAWMGWRFITTCSIQRLIGTINKIKDRDKLVELKNMSDDKIDKLANIMLSKFNELEKNIHLYRFGQDINQQCLMTIDNTLYCFTLTRNSTNSEYGLSVTHLNNFSNTEEIDKEVGNLYEYAVSSLDFCSDSNKLFQTNNETQCYLVDFYSAQTNSTTVKSRRDLTNYGILISTIDMNYYGDILSAIFEESLSELEL